MKKTLAEIVGTSTSPTAKLALLLEKIVRKVVREELQALNEGVRKPVAEAIEQPLVSPYKGKRSPSQAVSKIVSSNPILADIFATTTPFGAEENEPGDIDPMSLMADGWSNQGPAGSLHEVAPPSRGVKVVDVPAGMDETTNHIANIMNTTNFKAILDRSKQLDRN